MVGSDHQEDLLDDVAEESAAAAENHCEVPAGDRARGMERGLGEAPWMRGPGAMEGSPLETAAQCAALWESAAQTGHREHGCVWRGSEGSDTAGAAGGGEAETVTGCGTCQLQYPLLHTMSPCNSGVQLGQEGNMLFHELLQFI